MLKLAIKPDLKYVIVDAEGINQLDATGEEMLAQLTERLSSTGIEVLFARVKQQIMDVLVWVGNAVCSAVIKEIPLKTQPRGPM